MDLFTISAGSLLAAKGGGVVSLLKLLVGLFRYGDAGGAGLALGLGIVAAVLLVACAAVVRNKTVKVTAVVVLLAANLVLANLLVAPFGARVDLTEDQEHTITEATRKIIRELPDQVTVYGYFTEKSHEKLTPLIPKMKDLLLEYQAHGEGKIALELLDPTTDEALEEDAATRFNVKPVPFQVRSKYEKGVKSSYFHVVVAYGDQHQVLNFQQLIKVEPLPDQSDILVTLGNVEYEITSAIQHAVRSFGSLATRVAALDPPIEVTVFLEEADPEIGDDPNKESIETFLRETKAALRQLGESLGPRFPKGLTVEVVDPVADDVGKTLFKEYGLQPIPFTDPLSAALGMHSKVPPAHLALTVRHGREVESIPLSRGTTAASLTTKVEASIRRRVPGALPVIGMVTDKPVIPQEQLWQMRMQGQQPPTDDFEGLRGLLRGSYQVIDVKLDSGTPPLEADVLLVMRPEKLSEMAAYALDQYLMRGGRAIVFADRAKIDLPASRRSFVTKEVETGLDDLLAHYGLTLERKLAQDEQSLEIVVPIEGPGGRIRRESALYPWIVEVRADGIDRDNPVLARLETLALAWASPITVDASKQEGARFAKVVQTTDKAWAGSALTDLPVSATLNAPEERSRLALAVTVEGKLTSLWKGKRPPSPEKPKNPDNPLDPTAAPDDGTVGDSSLSLGTPVPEALADVRLCVIGDADMIADRFATQMLSEFVAGNVQLIQNLIDWALLDVDLVQIRSRGAQQRPLEELDTDKKQRIEWLNYAAVAALVLGFGVVRLQLRSAQARGRRRLAPTATRGA